MLIGVGYRHPLARWIESGPPGVDCLEITAEHFFSAEQDKVLERLSRRFSLFVHGLGLSLGTPGPLDQDAVQQFARVVRLADPMWISEHVAFTRTAQVDLGHLNPVPPTREMVDIIADHARAVADICQKPILLENITSHVQLQGELQETDFLNMLCEKGGCGLLLDVTNLYINSRNYGFDPTRWLQQLAPDHIVQLHIVGYAKRGERYFDSHAEPIQPELIQLAQEVAAYAPVRAIVLERDEDIPQAAEMEIEISKLWEVDGRH